MENQSWGLSLKLSVYCVLERDSLGPTAIREEELWKQHSSGTCGIMSCWTTYPPFLQMAQGLASPELLYTPPPATPSQPLCPGHKLQRHDHCPGLTGNTFYKGFVFPKSSIQPVPPFWSSETMHLMEFDILDIYAHNQKHLFTWKSEVGYDLVGVRMFTMRLNVL